MKLQRSTRERCSSFGARLVCALALGAVGCRAVPKERVELDWRSVASASVIVVGTIRVPAEELAVATQHGGGDVHVRVEVDETLRGDAVRERVFQIYAHPRGS